MPPFAYEMHEMAHLAWAPARAVSDVARTWLEHPGNPLSYTAAGRNLLASAKIFERLTRRYEKPAFDLATTAVDGKIVPIIERVAVDCRAHVGPSRDLAARHGGSVSPLL
jgi:poly(3-hydroxybutyrate) depolymerase